MFKRKLISIIASLALIILIRLFSGIYEDDEFNTKYIFIKNNPTWKWYFYSPRGMSDLSLEQMTEEQRNEQVMFEKFVSKKIISFPIE